MFPAVVSGDVEKLAIIDRVVGPFPEGFAREVDRTFGGVFSFNGGRVTVKYPPFEMSPSPTHHGDALRRLQAFRPLSVRSFISYYCLPYAKHFILDFHLQFDTSRPVTSVDVSRSPS